MRMVNPAAAAGQAASKEEAEEELEQILIHFSSSSVAQKTAHDVRRHVAKIAIIISGPNRLIYSNLQQWIRRKSGRLR